MPNKCSIPGCKTNYYYRDSCNKGRSIGVFRFPTDLIRRELWLSFIPRKDFIPTKNSRVCAKHFVDRFIVIDKRNVPRLTADSYPSIFSSPYGSPSPYFTEMEKERLDCAQIGCKQETDCWTSTDKVQNFSAFCRDAKYYLGTDKWIYEIDEPWYDEVVKCISFYYTPEPGELEPLFTVTISSDMHVKVYSRDTGEVPEPSLNDIFGNETPILVYWSQFVALISQCSISIGFQKIFFKPIIPNDSHKPTAIEVNNKRTKVKLSVSKQNGGLLSGETEVSQKTSDEEFTLPIQPPCGDLSFCHEEKPSLHASEAFGVFDEKDGEKRLRSEILQLTKKLNNSIQKMRNWKDLASVINLDVVSSLLVVHGNPEGKREVEKVYRLVQTIMRDTEEITPEHSVNQVWTKDNSKLKDDVLPMMFPTFKVNLPSTNNKTDGDREISRGYNHDKDYCHNRSHCLLDSSLKYGEQKEMNIKVNNINGVGRKATTRMPREKKAGVDKNCPRKGVACDICGKTFLNSIYLHKRNMHRELFSTRCSICGKEKSTDKLKAHMLTHSHEKTHQCSVCGKMFKWGRSLVRHTTSAHCEETPYTCSICGKGYKRSDHLKVHERSHMRKRKLYPFMKGADNLYHCKVCDKTFQLVSRLVWHMAHHSDEKPFQCTLCDKAYKWRGCLRKHQIVHKDEGLYECSLCPKKFKMKYRLKIHQFSHNELGRFTCEVCGKRFKWLRSLQKHQDLHKGEKLFDCSICSQKFKRREDLKEHEQVHASREELMEGGLHKQGRMLYDQWNEQMREDGGVAFKSWLSKYTVTI